MGDEEKDVLDDLNSDIIDKPNKRNYVSPDIVVEWRNYYLREGHSVHSTTTYFNYIKRYVGYGIIISQKSVDKFRETNMSSASSGALKNFFQFLIHKKGFPRELNFIYFDKSKVTKKMPKSITPFEVQKVIEAMPTLKDKLLTMTIYELGLRISEGLKLTWDDFGWFKWLQDPTKQGEVELKNTKGGKFRKIPVPQKLMKELYDNHKARNVQGIPIGGLVFDYGFKRFADVKKTELDQARYDYIVVFAEDKFRNLLYDVSKQVLGKRINPHMLRHSKAQDMMNRNVPIESIKKYLGHARISSTEIYAQASAEKLARDLEEYNKNDILPCPKGQGI